MLNFSNCSCLHKGYILSHIIISTTIWQIVWQIIIWRFHPKYVPCYLECRGEAELFFQFWLPKIQGLPFLWTEWLRTSLLWQESNTVPAAPGQWEESWKFCTIIWKKRDLNKAERHLNWEKEMRMVMKKLEAEYHHLIQSRSTWERKSLIVFLSPLLQVIPRIYIFE